MSTSSEFSHLKLRTQFLKYSVGGIASFLFDMLLIWIFVHMGMHEDLAFLIGFILSTMIFSFLFHKNVTFDAGHKKQTYFRYTIASIILFVLDVGGAIVFTKILFYFFEGVYHNDIIIMVGKTLGAGLGGLINFFFLRQWVFNEEEEE